MSERAPIVASGDGSPAGHAPQSGGVLGWLAFAVFLVLYSPEFIEIRKGWSMVDSYYSHGFLIPPISGYLLWKMRDKLRALPIEPEPVFGYALLILTGLGLVLADFLSLRVFMQLSMLPMLAALILIFHGKRHLAMVAFPLAFLVFMIPLPQSITQGVSLNIKLLATESAVRLTRLFTFPMVRDGSFVHFGDDKLLVGEVCGGLRSLISLLAFGALMANISKTRLWARILLFVVSGPVAVLSNIFRIFFLCVVGYYWGSGTATGRVHDVSGVLIFAVAFVLFLAFETVLRRIAPEGDNERKAP